MDSAERGTGCENRDVKLTASDLVGGEPRDSWGYLKVRILQFWKAVNVLLESCKQKTGNELSQVGAASRETQCSKPLAQGPGKPSLDLRCQAQMHDWWEGLMQGH